MSDAELVFLYRKNGDKLILQELILRHAGLVNSVVSRVSICREDAEDSFQATFLVLAKSLNKLGKAESLPSWLYGIAYRISKRARNHTLNSRRIQEVSDRETPSESANPFDQVSCVMEQERLDREINKLPVGLRAVIVERYYLGHSLQEISERMEISLSAVDGRLRRARTILRGRLLMAGLSATAMLGTAASNAKASSAVPALINATFKSVEEAARGSVVGGSTTFQELVQGELTMLGKAKWTMLSLVGGIFLVATTGTFMIYAGQSTAPNIGTTITLSDSDIQIEPSSGNEVPFALVEATSNATTSPGTLNPLAEDAKPGESTADPFGGDATTESTQRQTNLGLTLDELERLSSSELELLKAKHLLKQERSIEIKLMTSMISPSFQQIPLRAFVQELGLAAGVEMQFDERAIESSGVATPDDPVTLQTGTAIAVEQALQHILNQLELDYRIEGGIVVITAKGEVSVTQLYSVAGVKNLKELAVGLVKLVPNIERPTILGNSIALSASRDDHREVTRVLTLLLEQTDAP